MLENKINILENNIINMNEYLNNYPKCVYKQNLNYNNKINEIENYLYSLDNTNIITI